MSGCRVLVPGLALLAPSPPALPNRNTAMLAAVFGLAAYTLVAGLVRRAAGGPAAFRQAALDGALQLAAVASLPLAAMFALYWLFGH